MIAVDLDLIFRRLFQSWLPGLDRKLWKRFCMSGQSCQDDRDFPKRIFFKARVLVNYWTFACFESCFVEVVFHISILGLSVLSLIQPTRQIRGVANELFLYI